LAKAPLPKLLKLWSGLGYNRRALSLKALAQVVVSEHKGRLQKTIRRISKDIESSFTS